MSANPITDFLRTELDAVLARAADDKARIVMLAKARGFWSAARMNFLVSGEQPFGGPHPEHGDMTAADFVIVLGLIDAAKARIDGAREAAHA